jgi:2-phospho-L-lactate guanylyltransferase
MNWIAALPLKGPGQRKTRLAPLLGASARDDLALAMAQRTASVLIGSGLFSRILLLSPARTDIAGVEWSVDGGKGLNEELVHLRAQFSNYAYCVIHPDLPFLQGDDVAALLAAARRGAIAIAPDRRDSGTNAIALADGQALAFAFGPASFSAHLATAGGTMEVVRRQGLGFDVDTQADLEEARAYPGFTPVMRIPEAGIL